MEDFNLIIYKETHLTSLVYLYTVLSIGIIQKIELL